MKHTYHLFDVRTRQESKVWVNEYDRTKPIIVKRQRTIKKVVHAVKHGISQNHQIGSTEDSNSKVVYH